MTNEPNKDDKNPPTLDPADPKKVTDDPKADEKQFSQADLDNLAGKVRAEERAKMDAAAKLKAANDAEAARIAALQGEEKIKAEYNQRIKLVEEEKAKYVAELSKTKAVAELATLGYNSQFASYVVDADEAVMKANIAGFDKMVKAEIAKQISASVRRATPGDPTGGKADDSTLEHLRKVAGLPAKK